MGAGGCVNDDTLALQCLGPIRIAIDLAHGSKPGMITRWRCPHGAPNNG
jgi:hypothetical protein